jgi:hypothetical protein
VNQVPKQFDVLFDQIGFHVTLSELPLEYINVFNNDAFKEKLGDFLMKEFLDVKTQIKLKRLDYNASWGKN